MLSARLSLVCILIFLRQLYGERRIVDGQKLTTQKPYMVYLTQAKSTRNYDAWLCGGVIVHRWYILTSAACVEDVQNMYAIAGYEKYVAPKDLNTDRCTKAMKKKIIFTCVPEAYDLKYNKVEKWSKLDIALAKVESSYRFDDQSYVEHCSYLPTMIDINYDVKYQEAGQDVIVLGWGHTGIWREVKDKKDYNQKSLLYASTKIYAKEECKKYFKKPDLGDIIDKYIICTKGEGDIDDKGKPMSFVKRRLHNYAVYNRSEGLSNDINEKQNVTSLLTLNNTRRQGICQNDHGGPIITWVGGNEVVIGVASLFRLNEQSKCIPPYLYTSTAHNRVFIECVLKEEKNILRRSLCDKPASEKGFKIIRNHISWTKNSYRNISDNINMRPQIPMHYFQRKRE